ncbi:MAG: biotin/lipoyl-binding protein, partial [Gammaproteobacteria bacterium]|nr:biotin/lipoyl-binding protein [Gammaproteobacteria bacterium]
MTIEIKVPPLPESVTDATLVGWHKRAGESVARDENLVDLETDKVVLEVPAPASGTIARIVAQNGATVEAGDLLAILEEGDAFEPSAPAPLEEKQVAGEPVTKESTGPVKTSPAVRRLLDEHDLDATMVSGSGKDGRLTKADVMAFLKEHDSSDVTPGDSITAAVGEDAVVGLVRNEQRVPMTRLRARIAERLLEAQQTAAMLTTFNEVDLTQVMALRGRYRDAFEKKHGVRLGFMSFFAMATVEA